jgi:phosphodiesterase/alkaline phosphatase D-like protein
MGRAGTYHVGIGAGASVRPRMWMLGLIGAAALVPVGVQSGVSAFRGGGPDSFAVARGLGFSGGGVSLRFSVGRVQLRAPGGELSLAVAGLGRGHGPHPAGLGAPRPSTRGRVLALDRGAVREWYVARPGGIEQGFTVWRRPAGGEASLRLRLTAAGSVRPVQSGNAIRFLSPSGGVVFTYGELSAVDALGRRLPAQLVVSAGDVELRVWDRGARYPVRIDPLIQQGSKLTPSDPTGQPEFGQAVAIASNDGNTALIGGLFDNAGQGAAWLFTRSSGAWSQARAKLTGAGEGPNSYFGESVALSADGHTALVGAGGDGAGAAFVFVRSSDGFWAQQAKLTGSKQIGAGDFGFRVALSADGNTAMVTDPSDNNSAGAAWAFVRTNGTWAPRGSKLTAPGGLGGRGLALSGDGQTAVFGNPSQGTASVFAYTPGGGWTQQGAALTGAGATANAALGSSAALSNNGNVLLVGGPADNPTGSANSGAIWAFARSGSTWTAGTKLTATDELGAGTFGSSVAITPDGTKALVGGPNDNRSGSSAPGAAWTFTRSVSGTWTQQGSKLTATGETGGANFGQSVALAADGNSALIGGQFDNSDVGAVWPFYLPPAPAATTGTADQLAAYTARLNGTANPNGATTTFHYEYGPTTSYGTSAPVPDGSVGTDITTHSEPVTIGALAANTTYHYRIVAVNGGGTTDGADHTFTTLPPPPTATTGTADQITSSGARLAGTANPNGYATTYRFEYGKTSAYGTSVPVPDGTVGSDTTDHAEMQTISGLTPNTTYHFRIDASSANGTVQGADATFATSPPPVPPPTASTGAVYNLTATAALLSGTVNPEGSATTYHFEYGQTTAYGQSVPVPDGVAGTSAGDHVWSQTISGLTPSTTYHYRIVAHSAAGTVYGNDASFTTTVASPLVTTVAADQVTSTSAELNATVNPQGVATTYHFEWGTDITYGRSIPIPDVSAGSAIGYQAVAVTISSLSSSTVYHYRIVATNANGTSYGQDQALTTLPPPPTVTTGLADTVTGTSATLNGTVNPRGTATQYFFEYGPQTSSSYPNHTYPQDLGFSDTSAHAVSTTLTGLLDGQTYHYRVVAFNGDGIVSDGADQTFTTANPAVPAAPVITGVSPNKGYYSGGEIIRVTGSGFTGATVSFGGVAATTVTVDSDTSITVVVPAYVDSLCQLDGYCPTDDVTRDVSVQTGGGTSATTPADRYTYTYDTSYYPYSVTPAIESVTPSSGPTVGGTDVHVHGTGFFGGDQVYFGHDIPAQSVRVGDGGLIATSPAGSAGKVHVIVGNGGILSPETAADLFTYQTAPPPPPRPVVTGASPSSGSLAGGTTVEITGSVFTGATAVAFGGYPAASFTVKRDSQILAVAPPGPAPTTGQITVTGPGGESTTSAPYTWVRDVTAVIPDSGPVTGGNLVELKGSGFGTANAVTFDGIPATHLQVNSDGDLTVTAPPHAHKTVDVIVSGVDDDGKPWQMAPSVYDLYTYGPGPTVGHVVPGQGSTLGGNTVTIPGTNFVLTPPSRLEPKTLPPVVEFGGIPSPQVKFVSSTQLTAVAPAQGPGVVDVSVRTVDGSSPLSSLDSYRYAIAYTRPQGAAWLSNTISNPSANGGSITAVLKSGGLTLHLAPLGAGTGVVNWFWPPLPGHLASDASVRRTLVASGRTTLSNPSGSGIRIKLTPAGRRLLRRATRIRLTAVATFTPTGKQPIDATAALTLRR